MKRFSIGDKVRLKDLNSKGEVVTGQIVQLTMRVDSGDWGCLQVGNTDLEPLNSKNYLKNDLDNVSNTLYMLHCDVDADRKQVTEQDLKDLEKLESRITSIRYMIYSKLQQRKSHG